MDDKGEEKKESIDEILADLNDLLDKMPSILEGVRMPEVKPAIPAVPSPEEPPAPPAPPEASFPFETEAAAASEPPRDAGIDMFSAGAEAENEGISSRTDAGPPPEAGTAGPAPSLEDETALEEAFKMSFPDDERGGPRDIAAEVPKSGDPYGSTRDFGVPDIDALLEISQTCGPGVPQEPPAAQPETSAEAAPAQAEAPSGSAAAGPAGDVRDSVAAQAAAAQTDPAAWAMAGDSAQIGEEGPAGSGPAVAKAMADRPAAGGGTVEFRDEDVKKEEAAPAPEAGAEAEGIQLEPRAAPEPSETLSLAPEAFAATGEPPLAPEHAAAAGSLQQAGDPPPQPEEEKTMLIAPFPAAQTEEEKPLTLQTSGDVSATPADAQSPPLPEEEKTVVLAPPEEEKTVIYEPGSDPSAAGRHRGDLNELAVRTAPDGVPEERVRTLALLYVEGDADLCAEALAELDAICLKSAAKPMFIRRGFVKLCEAGMNGNYVLQMVSDAKAAGLLCVGSIPQESVYEIENAFNSSGVFFKHLKTENFSHSAMLDLVAELILR